MIKFAKPPQPQPSSSRRAATSDNNPLREVNRESGNVNLIDNVNTSDNVNKSDEQYTSEDVLSGIKVNGSPV